MLWGDCCEIQTWQHKAAELLYEPLHLEPASSVQIGGHHVREIREERFEHESRITRMEKIEAAVTRVGAVQLFWSVSVEPLSLM